jgi:hypothetical protein
VSDPLLLPGVVRQNGYVVTDLDAAMAEWLALGVGPWVTIGPMEQTMQYRRRTTTPLLTIAFANSGDLQIELIHQGDDAPSAYREFLEAAPGGGFHHLAWWTEDFDAVRAALVEAGHEIVLEGDGGGTARFLYVEARGSAATMLEVLELNDMTRFLTDHVRTGSVDWDGSDPVRPLF